MNIVAYTQVSLFDELKPEWNDLLLRSTDNRIFSTWEWQSAWWNAYAPGELWVLCCRNDEGLLVGLAPWFIEQHPELGRVVYPVGGREVTDYLDVIVDRDHVEPVLDVLTAHLAANRQGYDRFVMCNIPEVSLAYQRLPALLEAHGFSTHMIHEDVCPIIHLPATWDDYLMQLDKKQRHELRRKIRRAEGVPDMSWHIVTDNLEAELERFLELMAASDPDKARFLSDPQNVQFFKTMPHILLEKNWLQLAFLTVGDREIAAYLNFDYNGHVLVYNSGLLAAEYGHISPGIVLLSYIIQHAIETGHTVFDFLQGDEVYKHRMGGQDTHVYTLEAH